MGWLEKKFFEVICMEKIFEVRFFWWWKWMWGNREGVKLE